MTTRVTPPRTANRLHGAIAWLARGSILGPIWTYATSITIVAGPWILAVCALGTISILMEPVLGNTMIENLRLAVIYALCVAPLVAAPIATIAARVIRADIDGQNGELVSELFVVALIVSGAAAFPSSILVVLLLGITPVETGLAFVFLCTATAMLWTSLSILTALKAYRLAILAFGAGIGLSVMLILLAARDNPSLDLLIWYFAAGVVSCVVLMMARINWSDAISPETLVQATRKLMREARREVLLCAGVVLAFAGVWIDKWVLWFGPNGMTSAPGFNHFSTYDSVMFVAHLSIIPCFAATMLLHDDTLERHIGEFRNGLKRRLNYSMIRASIEDLSVSTWSKVFSIIFLQATITAMLVLMAPLLAKMFDFDFAQLLSLRVGLIAVFLHAIFYLSNVVLIACGRTHVFFWVQLLFCLSNLVASSVFFEAFGASAYGLLTSSLLAALVTFIFAYLSLQRYDYFVLVGENRTLYSDGTE